MQKISLPQNWTVRAVSNPEVPADLPGEIPAQVPGCIHLDLLRENLIPDPYLDQNENLVQWIGRTDWIYSTQFSVSDEVLKEERVDLVCEGLDTVATIWVNGVEIGKSENMHVEGRWDIKAALGVAQPMTGVATQAIRVATPVVRVATPTIGEEDQAIGVTTPVIGAAQPTTGEVTRTIGEVPPTTGEATHTIEIRFDSAALYVRAMRDRLGDLPHASSFKDAQGVCEPFHFIRKNACNFGWDWGPGLITCGIWKAIRLEAWSVARIKSVRPLVKVANEKVAVVDVEVEIEKTNVDDRFCAIVNLRPEKNWKLTKAMCDIYERETQKTATVFLSDPKLWWPRGYGRQNLYHLQINIQPVDVDWHQVYDEFECQIGLREVELDTSPDEIGAKWTLKVNGKPIWCKGANWIPDDVFLPRANDPARLETRLGQACDAGMNMMRVWGGGIYETDEFYALCDRMGLLVWQDFLFACAAYAEEEPMRSLVEAEARHNVTRLAKHPSLVLWNGCNENIWGWFDWKWQEKVGNRTWGLGYYLDLLPKIVAELDPTRPYWPGSPYSGSMDIHPNADQWGNRHIWDTWNEVNHTHFRRYSPRFASEFGHQAPPTFSTLARSIPEDGRTPSSPAMLHHQKAAGGNDKLHARLHEHFETPDNFDDWIYLTQLMQARAMTTAVEWFRTRASCAGALYWQLNDCWPVTSWAAIDGDGREKPLYFATKQFFRSRLLTIQPDGEHLALWAHNDSDAWWHSEAWIELQAMNSNGWKVEEELIFAVPPRTLEKVATLEKFQTQNPQNEFIYAGARQMGIGRYAFWFFDTDKNLAYPEPKFGAELNGNMLKITAETLLRDLYLNADRVGGRVKKNLVTLLPGETWEVEIEGGEYDLEMLTSRPVLNCANWFGANGRRP